MDANLIALQRCAAPSCSSVYFSVQIESRGVTAGLPQLQNKPLKPCERHEEFALQGEASETLFSYTLHVSDPEHSLERLYEVTETF